MKASSYQIGIPLVAILLYFIDRRCLRKQIKEEIEEQKKEVKNLKKRLLNQEIKFYKQEQRLKKKFIILGLE